VALYVEVHPRNPQPRSIAQVAELLREGALIAYPTDSCYALGCTVDSPTGADRMRRIRGLEPRHHFTLVCANFGQLGQYVQLDTAPFRAIKAATPGPYTFILPATKEVPRRFADPKKRTVGVRIPNHPVVRALLEELGAPLVSTTLLLPGATEPMSDGWQIKEELDHVIDAVIDAGECGTEPSSVINWADGYPEVVRIGAGDVARFES
jgi:tRNA threonylcarbamoyl adenosine modification protein (Sua5/YciO/YrdC/YwlC family)